MAALDTVYNSADGANGGVMLKPLQCVECGWVLFDQTCALSTTAMHTYMWASDAFSSPALAPTRQCWG